MTEFKFEPEDFDSSYFFGGYMTRVESAKTANAKIAPLLARLNELEAYQRMAKDIVGDAPILYCRKDDGKWACDEHIGFARTTHKGRLIGIEEIK